MKKNTNWIALVRRLVKKHGSFRKLADATGIAASTLSDIANGRTAKPTLEHALILWVL